jgi:hypothetical protein
MKDKNLTAKSMKLIVFWDAAPCGSQKLTDVSEVRTASAVAPTIG